MYVCNVCVMYVVKKIVTKILTKILILTSTKKY